jgi:succinate--hydroxymethylglutarate CoA-transferase
MLFYASLLSFAFLRAYSYLMIHILQDDTRHWRMKGEDKAWKSEAGPISNYFSAVNRNKRSVTLNLKDDKGKEILLNLARNADVL